MMSSREVIRAILQAGGYKVRQRGSHGFYRIDDVDDEGAEITAQTTVKEAAKDIPEGTLIRKIDKDLSPVLGKGWLIK